MIEENPELTHRCNLTSMSDKGFFELVWENGQLLMRDLPGRGQKSSSCNGHSTHDSSINAHLRVKNGGDTFPPKKSKFETLDSILGDSHHNNNFYLNSLQVQDDNLHESWPEYYQTHFNVFQEQYKGNNYDKTEDSQVVPVHEHENLKTGCTSDCFAETSQLAPTSQPDRSSLKQYQESAPLKRRSVNSRKNIVSIDELLDSKLQEQDLESDRERVEGNFSLFLRSPLINSQRCCVKMATSAPAHAVLSRADQELKNSDKRSSTPASDNPLESMPIALANGSKTFKGFHYQPSSSEAIAEWSPRSAKPRDKSLQDNQSETDFRDDAFANKRSNNQVYGQTSKLATNKGKGKLKTQKSKELPVASSSLCSRGASNNPIYTLKRRYEDTEGSADEHPSQHIEKKPKSVTKVVPGSKGNRKRRAAEVHSLSERRRRDKINKKMRALQELIPNCNKVDKASMLDEAIEYLKTLQLQVQMMSMGSRVCMPQMMLPTGLQQIHTPQMTHFSPMPMRMQTGFGCNPSHLLISQNPGGPAVPRPGMPGFLPQLLPMSVLPAPFVFGLFSQVPGAPPTSAPTELMASATVSNLIHNINSEKKKQC